MFRIFGSEWYVERTCVRYYFLSRRRRFFFLLSVFVSLRSVLFFFLSFFLSCSFLFFLSSLLSPFCASLLFVQQRLAAAAGTHCYCLLVCPLLHPISYFAHCLLITLCSPPSHNIVFLFCFFRCWQDHCDEDPNGRHRPHGGHSVSGGF